MFQLLERPQRNKYAAISARSLLKHRAVCHIEAICLMEFLLGAFVEATFLSGVLVGLLAGVFIGVLIGNCKRSVKVEVKRKESLKPEQEVDILCTDVAAPGPGVKTFVTDVGLRMHWRRDCPGLNAARRVREVKGCSFCFLKPPSKGH